MKVRETVPLRAVRRALSYGEFARVLGPDFIIEALRHTVAAMARTLETPHEPS